MRPCCLLFSSRLCGLPHNRQLTQQDGGQRATLQRGTNGRGETTHCTILIALPSSAQPIPPARFSRAPPSFLFLPVWRTRLLPPFTPARAAARPTGTTTPLLQMAGFVQQNEVQGVLQGLLKKLLVARPDEPLAWLVEEVEKNPPFKAAAEEASAASG